jgi:tRNA(Arg) A34 adenosine deaminase TadA
MDKQVLMRQAIELSREGLRDGRGSYCATLIVKDNEVIGRGWNTVVQDSDPTAHCEINAMREAAKRLGTWNLSGCELYTTWEPCPLCVAAIYWARIDRVYYANLLTDAIELGMDIDGVMREVRSGPGERSRPYERLLGDEAIAVVREWWDRERPEPI